jgi:hypothetical protein
MHRQPPIGAPWLTNAVPRCFKDIVASNLLLAAIEPSKGLLRLLGDEVANVVAVLIANEDINRR